MTVPVNVFAASRLGAFLRAMADPEGTGLDATSERDIAAIERRIADACDKERS